MTDMTTQKKLLATLSAEERELLKEAEYQGGGGMMCDGSTMERLLKEVASYRIFEQEIRAAVEATKK